MTASVVLGGARRVLGAITYGAQLPMIGYFLLINSSYLILILLAGAETLRHARRLPYEGSPRPSAGGSLRACR